MCHLPWLHAKSKPFPVCPMRLPEWKPHFYQPYLWELKISLKGLLNGAIEGMASASLPLINRELPAPTSMHASWMYGKYHSSCRVISASPSAGILVPYFISSENQPWLQTSPPLKIVQSKQFRVFPSKTWLQMWPETTWRNLSQSFLCSSVHWLKTLEGNQVPLMKRDRPW